MILSKHCPSQTCNYFVAVSPDQKEGECTCGCKFRVVHRLNSITLEQTNRTVQNDMRLHKLLFAIFDAGRTRPIDLIISLRLKRSFVYDSVTLFESKGLITSEKKGNCKYLQVTDSGLKSLLEVTA